MNDIVAHKLMMISLMTYLQKTDPNVLNFVGASAAVLAEDMIEDEAIKDSIADTIDMISDAAAELTQKLS